MVRYDDNELVTPSHPIHRSSGSALVIYLTGLGQTAPAVATGQPAPSNPLSYSVVQPTVTLGGVNLPVLFSGLAPGLVGVDQINVSVPTNVPDGNVRSPGDCGRRRYNLHPRAGGAITADSRLE